MQGSVDGYALRLRGAGGRVHADVQGTPGDDNSREVSSDARRQRIIASASLPRLLPKVCAHVR